MSRESTNLLAETIAVIQENGKSPADVSWVGFNSPGTEQAKGTWADFASLAAGINYNAGYGGNEIATGLLVVGPDWWLERHEYDGSEWWEFKQLPTPPALHRPLTKEDLEEHW